MKKIKLIFNSLVLIANLVSVTGCLTDSGSSTALAPSLDQLPGDGGSGNLNPAPTLLILTAPISLASVGSQINVQGVCETGAQITVSGDVIQDSTLTCVNWNFNGLVILSAGDGTKNLQFQALNSRGGQASLSLQVIRDTAPPALSIDAPLALSSSNSQSLIVTGSCEGNNLVQLTGSGLLAPVSGSCTNSSYSLATQLTNGDGIKIFQVGSTDNIGNAIQVSRAIELDQTIPAISVQAPSALSVVNHVFGLSLNCEIGSELTLTGDITPLNLPCLSSPTLVGVSVSMGDGIKNLVIGSQDSAGNQNQVNFSVTQDTAAPALSFASPSANSFYSANVPVVIGCEVGTQVQLSGDISPITSQNCTNGTLSLNVTLSPGDGPKTISAVSNDLVGNTATTTLSVNKDSVAPNLQLNSPFANSFFQTLVGVTANCENGTQVQIGGDVLAPVSGICQNSLYQEHVLLTSGEGAKQLAVTSIDSAGNQTVRSIQIVRDTLAPHLSIVTPVNSYNVNSSFDLIVSCETGASVSVFGDVLPVSQNCQAGMATFNSRNLIGADGSKLVQVSSSDVAGNMAITQVILTKDTQAPTLNLLSPVAGSSFQNQINLEGACESGLNVAITGTGIVSPSTVNCSGDQFSAILILTSGEGPKSINLGSTDLAGNATQTTHFFIRDNSPPTLSLSSPLAGSSATNGFTLTGVCENGLTILFSGTGLSSSSNTVCASGSFSNPIVFSSGDGAKEINLSATDEAGNITTISRTLTKDSIAPLLSFSSPSQGTASKLGLTISGTCESGLNILIAGTGVAGSTLTTCNSGTFSQSILYSSGDGSKEVSISSSDAAGNTSSLTRSFVRDNSAPILTMNSPADGTASQNTLTVSGTCENFSSLSLSGTGLGASSNPTCVSGQFSSTITLSSGDGNKAVTMTATDSAGNVSTISRQFVRDTVAPALSIAAPTDGFNAQSGVTITGTCENGLVVQISGTGISANSSVTCSSGAFSQAVVFSSGEGSKAVVLTSTDAAGNSATVTRNFVRDSIAPVLTLSSPAANAAAQNGVTLMGSCETGRTVVFSGAGLSSNSSVSCSAGSFSSALIFSSGDGSKSVTATSSDSAGNTSTATRVFIKDSVAPVLTLTSPANNTQASAGVTITGTCENGASIAISGSGIANVTAAICSTGTFSQLIAFSSGEGNKAITIASSDAAGNSSSVSRTFIRDSVAPLLSISAPAANTVFQNGFTLTGTCETGLSVNFSGSGLASSSSATCTSGSYSQALVFSPGDGAKVIVVTQTDAASNATTVNRSFVRDTTAPVLALTSPADGTSSQTGVTLSGTCETNITISGAGLGGPSSASCLIGAFTQTITFSAGDGNKNIILTSTDSAGNSATVSRNFVRDNLSPNLTISSPSSNAQLTSAALTVTGACESGITVALTGSGLSNISSASCVAGNYSTNVTLTAGLGSKAFQVAQTDGAGNSSQVTRSVEVVAAGAVTAPTLTLLSENPTRVQYAYFSATCQNATDQVLVSTSNAAPSVNDANWKPCSDVHIVDMVNAGAINLYGFSKSTSNQISLASGATTVTHSTGFEVQGVFPVQNARFLTSTPVRLRAIVDIGTSNPSATYRLNSGSWISMPINSTNSTDVVLTGLAVGTHTVDIRVEEGAASTTITKNFQILASHSGEMAPDIEVLAPANRTFYFQSPKPLRVLASQGASRLRRIIMYAGTGTATACSGTTMMGIDYGGGGPFSDTAVLEFDIQKRMIPMTDIDLCFIAQNPASWPNKTSFAKYTFTDPTNKPPASVVNAPDFSLNGWNQRFIKQMNGEKFVNYTNEHTGEDYAWTASYWVKAHIKMAENTGSLGYVQKAKRIVDIFMMGRDAERNKRNENGTCYGYTGLSKYNGAPLYLRKDRTKFALGWSRPFGGGFITGCTYPNTPPKLLEVSLLVDSNIVEAIMQYVDFVLTSKKYPQYEAHARSLINPLREIIDSHEWGGPEGVGEGAWAPSLSFTVGPVAPNNFVSAYTPPGTYSFPGGLYRYHYNQGPTNNVNGVNVTNPYFMEPWTDPQYATRATWSNPVPLNFVGYLFTATLLMEKHDPNFPAKYRQRAESFAYFFKTMTPVRANGSYTLMYAPSDNAGSGAGNRDQLEDLPHGTTEAMFLKVAYDRNLSGITLSELTAMAKTYNSFKNGANDIYYTIDNQRPIAITREHRNSVGLWFSDLAPYEPGVMEHIVNVMNRWDPLDNSWYSGTTFADSASPNTNPNAPYTPSTANGRTFWAWASIMKMKAAGY